MNEYLEALRKEFRPTLRSRVRGFLYRLTREGRDARLLNCGHCGQKRKHSEWCPERMFNGHLKVAQR